MARKVTYQLYKSLGGKPIVKPLDNARPSYQGFKPRYILVRGGEY